MKKIIGVILCAAVIVTIFCSCSDNGGSAPENDPPQTLTTESVDGDGQETKPSSNVEKNFALPYSKNDSLNPYKAESKLNLYLSTLIYDSLYRLDSSFTANPLLAQAGIIEGKQVTVTLKDGLFFTDKTRLTAYDVYESFKLAKKTDNYGEVLKNFASAQVVNGYAIRFTLSEPDAFAFNCLTFPVIKSGQGEKDIPTGSGRYRYSSGKLIYNENHIMGEQANFKTLYLFNIKSSSYENGALQIGNVSFIFHDFADGETHRIIAQEKKVTLNNLVFLAFNGSNKLLKNSNLRRIISLAIDRQGIARGAFRGYAKDCGIPFNPDWEKAADIEPEIYTAEQMTEMLEKYNYRYASAKDEFRSDKNGNKLELKLVVNKDNAFRKEAAAAIKNDLGALGINVKIENLGRKDYLKAVKEGEFDMYLGEIKLCENMNLGCFFDKNGGARYGIDKNSGCVKQYRKLLSGEIDVGVFVDSFKKDMPFAPVCFRCGSAVFSNELKDNAEVCLGDLFGNINEWEFK